ncbi:MAG: hypothetical protein ACOC9J_02000 [Persicimonas sp.]
MARKRRKAKNKKQKQESEESKKFMLTLIGLGVLFIIAFFTLRFIMS